MLVAASVVALPFTLVFEEFCAVKAASPWEEMTQDCMPVVIQPRSDVAPECMVAGFATRIMVDGVIWTEHCAPEVTVPLLQVRPYVAVFVPSGGVWTLLVAVPD